MKGLKLLGALTAGTFLITIYNNRHFSSKLKSTVPILKTCQLDDRRNGSKVPDDNLFKPPERPDLPTLSMEEVRKHGKEAGRIWVTFKQVC